MIKKGVSYFGNRFLNHFKKDLQEILSAGCHYIVHTFSENDLLYYRQTLKDFVKLSKDKGLEVYIDPWGVGRLFGGEAFSEFIASHPEECQVLASGERVSAACPNSPSFREFMRKWVEAACELNPDVVFWDEPHYFVRHSSAPISGSFEWACFCDSCRKKFEDEHGHRADVNMTEEMGQFKQKSLLDFLNPLLKNVKMMQIKNAICLLPVPLEKIVKQLGILEWESFAAHSDIDIISTDPYWALMKEPLDRWVRKHGEQIVRLALQYKKESEIWIQGFRIPAGREGEVHQALRLASDLNPNRLAVWSYRGTSCMSELSCDRPGKVWRMIKKDFKKMNVLEGDYA